MFHWLALVLASDISIYLVLRSSSPVRLLRTVSNYLAQPTKAFNMIPSLTSSRLFSAAMKSSVLDIFSRKFEYISYFWSQPLSSLIFSFLLWSRRGNCKTNPSSVSCSDCIRNPMAGIILLQYRGYLHAELFDHDYCITTWISIPGVDQKQEVGKGSEENFKKGQLCITYLVPAYIHTYGVHSTFRRSFALNNIISLGMFKQVLTVVSSLTYNITICNDTQSQPSIRLSFNSNFSQW